MHQSTPLEFEKDASEHLHSADALPDRGSPIRSFARVHSGETTPDIAASLIRERDSCFSLLTPSTSDTPPSPKLHGVGFPRSLTRSKVMVSTEEIAESLDDWKRLDTHADSPLLESIWFYEAMHAFESEGSPRLTVITMEDRWTAVAPVVEKTVRGVRRNCLAGAGELHEPADLIADDQGALNCLIDALLQEGRPILMERVLDQSPSVKAFKENFQRRAIVIKRQQAPCPYIELNDTWLEPESHLNAGRRSDFRRARRKAEKLGEVSIQILAPRVDELSELIDRAFEIEGKSWKGEARTALVHDSNRARFFEEYARRAAEDGILRVCFLTIDGQSAAMQLAIEHKQAFWLLKVGYDDRFCSCSPGLLLMRETIRYAAERGLKSYELLGVTEDWTAVWTKAEHQTVSLWIYPISWCGLFALFVDVRSKLLSRWSRS